MKPDIEVQFVFNNERRTRMKDGFRPAHLVQPNYLATGIHHYYNRESVFPNEKAMGTITFLTPEYYPHSLWVGKIISVQDGSRVIGYAVVKRIFNSLLDRDAVTVC